MSGVEPKPSFSSALSPYLCLLYGSLSALSYALCGVIVQSMSYSSPALLSLVANAGMLVFDLPLVVYAYDAKLGLAEVGYGVLTGVFISTGICVRFYAFRWLPLGEVAVVSCTTPLVVALVARVVLGEALGVVQAAVTLVAIAGVLLSARIPRLFGEHRMFHWEYFAGLTCSVVAVVFLANGIVLLRRLKHVHFSVRVLFISVVGLAINAAVVAVSDRPLHARCGVDPILEIFLGFFLFVGDCFFALAAQSGQAAVASLVKSSTDVVFAVMLQLVFFRLVPDAYNAGGAALVLLAMGTVAVRQWLASMPEDAAARKTLKFLLA